MSTRTIPAVGLRAFRLLTEQNNREIGKLMAQYQQDCEALGDDILDCLGVNPTSDEAKTLTVCYGDGTVTGFPEIDAPSIADVAIAETMAKMKEVRVANGVVDGYVAPEPEVPHTNGVAKKRGRPPKNRLAAR